MQEAARRAGRADESPAGEGGGVLLLAGLACVSVSACAPVTPITRVTQLRADPAAPGAGRDRICLRGRFPLRSREERE